MSKSSATSFESFSNDLLFDLFEYFDIYSLFHAFYGLNQRFNDLIHSSPVHYEFNGTTNDDDRWQSIASVIKPSQIRSICITGPYKIDKRFINDEVKQVKSLFFRSVENDTLDEILSHLPSNLHVENFSQLGLPFYPTGQNRSPIKLVFDKYENQFKRLVNASLRSSFPIENLSPNPFLCLRRLHLETSCISVALFMFLHNQTPNLASLRLVCTTRYRTDFNLFTTIRLDNIRELDVNSTDEFLYLSQLLSFFPNVRKLRVMWEVNRRSIPLVNGSQCQTLFEQHLTKVKQFTLEFSDNCIVESIIPSFYLGEFWSKHPIHLKQIIVKWQRLSPKIRSIYFGKEWHFDYFDGTRLSP